ncbi:MAG: hypothetical protein ACQES1_03055 [Bacteroidota bacterium]
MKKILYLLVLVFIIGNVNAQEDSKSDFNEPPTRSEFEQLKSKIQVYERKLNQVLGRMNSFNDEIDKSLTKLDSAMQKKMMQMEDTTAAGGLDPDVKSQFLTQEDFNAFEEKMMATIDDKLDKQAPRDTDEKTMLYIYGIAGLSVILLILLIVLWIISGKRFKKQKAEIDEKMQQMDENEEKFRHEFEETKNNLQKDLKNEIKKMEDALMVKINSNKTHIDVKYKDLNETMTKRIEDLKNEVDAAHVSATKQNEEKIQKVQKRANEAIEEQTKKSEADIREITDKIAALKKEMDKLEKKQK